MTKGWGGSWVVELEAGSFIVCRSVVMACGGFEHAKELPAGLSGHLPPHVTEIHSRDYKNPESLPSSPDAAVLIVGSAQSGTQIMAELARAGRKVYLSVGSRSLRVPRQVRGRDFTWWLHRTGLFDQRYADLSQDLRTAKRFGPNPSQAPGCDIRFREYVRDHGVVLLGKLLSFDERAQTITVDGTALHTNMQRIEQSVADKRSFVDAFIAKTAASDPDLQTLPPMEHEPECEIPDCELNPIASLDLDARGIRTVINCTGFKFSYSDLVDEPGLFGVGGYPEQKDGAATQHPGLYFLGLHWMRQWKSAIMLGCADDAEVVVAQIARASAKRDASSSTKRQLPVGRSEPPAVSGAEGQLSSANAAALDFGSWVDLVPRSDAPAIVSVDPAVQPLSFARLVGFITEELPAMMAKCGVGPEDRLCVVIPNGPEAAVAFLGFHLYCQYAPLNPNLKAKEYTFEFEDLPAKAVVVLRGAVCQLALDMALQLKLPVIEMVVQQPAGLFTLEWLHNASEEALTISRPAARGHTALVLHTSGTTKLPKIVPLTVENIVVGALCIKSTLRLDPASLCLNLMPLFHIHGISINVLASILAGAPVICVSAVNSMTQLCHLDCA